MKHAAKVIKGQGRSRSTGFPTFNLELSPDFQLKQGVYAAWVWLHGQKYPGALHYGPVPVFQQKELSLEIHALDYLDTKPVKNLIFEPIKFLRPVRNFSSPASLSAQIQKDITRVRRLLLS